MRATVPVLLGLLLAACSSGGGGDSVPHAQPVVTGTGDRLAELNDPANPRPTPTAIQNVSGVSVVAVDAFDETSNGKSAGAIYVEDLAHAASDGSLESCSAQGVTCPYSGIELFAPSFNPPALRVAPGDVVDVRGQYQEFAGPPTFLFPPGETLPEMVGATVSLRFEYDPLPAAAIDLVDLKDYATGRQWLGMLVRVDDVTLFDDAAASSGRYSAHLDVGAGVQLGKVPTVTNALFDLAQSGVPMTKGTHFASITGVVQYFQNFSIAPRSAADLVQ